MQQISVKVDEGYSVFVGKKLLDKMPEQLKTITKSKKCVVVTDSNVEPLYLERFVSIMRTAGYEIDSFVVKAGENSKNLECLGEVLEFLAEKELTRSDFIIALGGGVVGDLTGFAAGCYMRGIDYVQVPTTLLAAVDSSVGGKTAVDLRSGKNLAGLFVQPKLVICDINLLNTLPEKTFKDGMAEAIKTGILAGEPLFSMFEDERETRESDEWKEKMIAGCIAYKAKVVEQDPKEKNVRRLLNLGHTPAHGIEKISEFQVSHGRAVAKGLEIIVDISCREGFLAKKTAERIQRVIALERFEPISKEYTKNMQEAMKHDKKRKGNQIALIMPMTIGHCEIKEYDFSKIEELFEAY